MASKECANCGAKAGKTAVFCSKCGHPLNAAPEPDIQPLTEATLDALADEPVSEDAVPADPFSEEAAAMPDTPEPAPKAPSDQVFVVRVLNRLSAGKEVCVTPEKPVVVGSDDAADLRIAGDSTVSRTHARFTLDAGKLLVADQGSTNGTFIMVREVREVVAGDVLVLGDTVLQIRREE